ncbi:DUF2459 domain-containing protein [Mycobacterium sp. KBS0706]|uniref:DUF2459 domain-containing protein n=1 Tax=Mycobacterium sp. KBS0706 TaxID=2578109 RepID=UPI00110F76F4|nr:DUF2459 domain-containing protein [Mycobacterium sp. KBS0706]TSD85310.1 DUF2459 domain-containing protein [Mycobacterium sp. KBS0706]
MKALRLALAIVAALAAGLLGLAVLYVGVALALALVPLNGRAQATSDPPAYVCATLTHTDIVLPARDELVDWTAVFPDSVLVAFVPNLHVAFGWGDLTFYRETPSWADLRFRTAIAALFGGGPSALHVAYVLDPAGVPGCTRLALDREGREALIGFIRATAALDPAGRGVLAAPPGTGTHEAFYVARGTYRPWRTCNVWTVEALRTAGAPTALWAPFSFGVMWPLV